MSAPPVPRRITRTLTFAVAALSPSLVTVPVRLPDLAPAARELSDVTPTPAACAAGAAASTASATNDAPPARLKRPSMYDPSVATRVDGEGPMAPRGRQSRGRGARSTAARAWRKRGRIEHDRPAPGGVWLVPPPWGRRGPRCASSQSAG